MHARKLVIVNTGPLQCRSFCYLGGGGGEARDIVPVVSSVVLSKGSEPFM